jgi:hypothetical protein
MAEHGTESVEYSNLSHRGPDEELLVNPERECGSTRSLEDIDVLGCGGGVTKRDGLFGGCAGMEGFVLEWCFEWVFGDDGFSWCGCLGETVNLVFLVWSVTRLKHGSM